LSKIISNVSGKQKKQIDAAVKKARPNGNGKVPVTAQQSIPFKQMFKDGICKVDDNYYTKTVQFFDIKEPLIKSFLPFFAALSVTDFRVLLKTAKR